MKRVGMLTSGGDCQGLNAALHGVAKALYESYDEDELEIYGISDGSVSYTHLLFSSLFPYKITEISTEIDTHAKTG